MFIYQLILETKINDNIYQRTLETTKNKQQLEEIITSLNKKHKKDDNNNPISFHVVSIDTTKVINSLDKNQIKYIY